MAVDRHSVEAICKTVSQEVADHCDGMSLYFIVHGDCDFKDMIALSEHNIISHPAAPSAKSILRQHATNNKTSFLGLAIHQKKRAMGLKRQDFIMAIANINIDDLKSISEARLQIYHLAWHAIDLYEIRKEPRYRKKFAYGPMVPKRSPLNLSKANMQADIFAALVTSLQSGQSTINELLRERTMASLEAAAHVKPEDYPFVIAHEACEFALQELKKEISSVTDIVKECRTTSLYIGQAFDEKSIRRWWKYATPAQDMAWRGFSKADILGGAVNTCDNTYVRAIALMIAKMSNIEPSSASALERSYNAFLDTESLAISHMALIDTVFEEAIDASEESGSRALLDAANKQNENLTEGRILGWCANALQEAAHAFEKALISGSSPTQAARMHFEGNKGDTSWDMLKELGDSVVDQRRRGFAVTMGHIAEICHNHPAFAPVLGSLKVTMNDPGYLNTLEASNDILLAPKAPTNAPSLGPKTPAPKGPAPKGPELGGPAPTPAPAGPTLGSKDRSRQMEMRRRLLAAQQAEKNNEQRKSDQPVE